ncbi:MAG: DUF3536 domain-containing protein [Desulfovibrionaceae bacterium]
MTRQLCIHGHFYQPPREDPWLDEILPEGSAAPQRHWNERICLESYAPLAHARRLDGAGRIFDVVNCYEWMSFNFGPTLLKWMERAAPEAYGRVLAGDAAGAARLGHGNALAQIYHHIIMPLASPLDKEVEVAWAVADFEARFGRKPAGMWLSEAAVDTPTLEVLAAYGVRFTILAPRQAAAVAELGDGAWNDVHEGGLDITQPYQVDLPSGARMAVFFYHGPLSQAVAFERLLENGEQFWHRLAGSAGNGLLSIGTDGETYGHHFPFGEMALAYVIGQAMQGRDNVALTNYAAYLAANPPTQRVRLHEPSSWSCVHGVERWRGDCGCGGEGNPGWNQKWRKPLRAALDAFKAQVDAHYFATGGAVFKDPHAALLAYGGVLARTVAPDAFLAAHGAPRLDKPGQATAWRLLAMQQWALASFASCAWFFDEISRIEPLNGMTYALRAMDLCRITGGPDLEKAFAKTLGAARSNYPKEGTGRDLFARKVRPRLETGPSIVAQALLRLHEAGGLPKAGDARTAAWPGVSVSVAVHAPGAGGAAVTWGHEPEPEAFGWTWPVAPGADPVAVPFQVAPSGSGNKARPSSYSLDALPWNKKQGLALRQLVYAEDTLWEERVREARVLARRAQPWAEAQSTPNLAWRWGRFWAEFAWLHALGELDGCRGADALRDYVRSTSRVGYDVQAVEHRVVTHVLGLTEAASPQWREAEAVVARMGEIGLALNWLPVQAVVWRRARRTPAAAGLRHLLGFAE